MKPQHAAAAIGALALAVLAFSPLMDTLADRSFAWHMAQHMMLIFGVAPLVLLAAPMLYIIRWTPHDVAKGIVKALHSWPVRAIAHPVSAWLLFAIVLWGTHLTPLYNLALHDERVHIGEHAAYFVCALLFWQNVIQIGPAAWPLPYPLRMLYVFSTIPQSAFLGVILFQANHVLYPAYAQTERFPLLDQHNGGALMWILGGLLLFSTFMILGALWAHTEQQASERLDARLESL